MGCETIDRIPNRPFYSFVGLTTLVSMVPREVEVAPVLIQTSFIFF